MQERGWMHRDLKPGNLMLSEHIPSSWFGLDESKQSRREAINFSNGGFHNVKLKIGDYGLSKCVELPTVKNTKEIMTLWYRAPEVLLDNLCYNSTIDLWSAGVIIFEMLTGKPLFKASSEIDMIM